MTDPDKAFDYKVSQILERDERYHRESFTFIKDAVTFTHEINTRKPGKKRHVSVEELVDSIKVFALCEYGPMAKTVLNHWGIHTTEDFGHLIFLLAEAGELELRDSDTIEKFSDVFSFEEAFNAPFSPENSPVNTPTLDED